MTVVDLPDPLETPPTGTAGTDDLLSQLAGDEIDRLLAEADVERPAPPAGGPSSIGPEVPRSATAPAAGTTGAPADPASPTTSTARAAVEAELDEVFNRQTGDAGEDEAADEAATGTEPVNESTPAPTAMGVNALLDKLAAEDERAAAEPVPVPDPAPAAAAADSLEAEMATSAEERAALAPPEAAPAADAQPSAQPAPAAAPAPASAAAEMPGDKKPSPDDLLGAEPSAPSFVVRILEWVNAPLDFLPDGAREAAGKIAILTLVNAVAVLIYVLFFRR